LAADADEWSASHLSHFTPRKNPAALIQWDKAFELSALLIWWQFFVTQVLPF